MKTRCACCNSNNLHICSEEDAENYDKEAILEHCYECLDCDYSGVLDVEDWYLNMEDW